MNDFRKKMNEKIKLYSNEEYLAGYIKNEYFTNNQDADIFLKINSKEDLFDSRTVSKQVDLLPSIYKYIEDKTSMLDNTVPIQLHIIGVEFSSKEKELIQHLIKEHYAIELYKVQKRYNKSCSICIIRLMFGILCLLSYAFLTVYHRVLFFLEVFSFLFSFTLWEAFDKIIYTFTTLNNEKCEVTQNLLLTVEFHENDNFIKKEL